MLFLFSLIFMPLKNQNQFLCKLIAFRKGAGGIQKRYGFGGGNHIFLCHKPYSCEWRYYQQIRLQGILKSKVWLSAIGMMKRM